MKFNRGDLVAITSPLGELINECPPALILSGGIGYSVGIHKGSEPEEIYTILFSGGLETKVSADWLDLVERAGQPSP